MYITDFEYDGVSLSSKGYMPCNFGASSGEDVVDTGAKITFNKVAFNSGRKYHLTSSKYNDCVSISFDICKNSDCFYSDEVITNSEYVDICRWLNRQEFKPLKLICNYYEHTNSNNSDIDEYCYYNGSFNIDEIKVGDILYGLRLTFESDSPFGYIPETTTLEFLSNGSATVADNSDDTGWHYPTFKITCKADGDLTLKNTTHSVTTVIKNCKNGEVITVDSLNQIIMIDSYPISSANPTATHKIENDFNYIFPKVCNSRSKLGDNRSNVFTASLPCTIEITTNRTVRKII